MTNVIKRRTLTVNPSAFRKTEVINKLDMLHEVPADKADKAYNYIVFVYTAYYNNLISNGLGINSIVIVISLQRLFHENLQNHISIFNTFKILSNETCQNEFPYLYRKPKLHKNPYKDTLLVILSQNPTLLHSFRRILKQTMIVMV